MPRNHPSCPAVQLSFAKSLGKRLTPLRIVIQVLGSSFGLFLKLTLIQSWHNFKHEGLGSITIALLIEIHFVAILGLWPWAQDDLSRNVHGSLLSRQGFWEGCSHFGVQKNNTDLF